VVESVFFDRDRLDARLIDYFRSRFRSRPWRLGLLRTIRGTRAHRVRELLPRINQPTLLVVGREDRIVDPEEAISAASLLRHGRLEVLSACGHAPQIEQARIVNRLVVDFLTQPTPER
jgi:pimeloyl-ACP methyl ester carboxylesterase